MSCDTTLSQLNVILRLFMFHRITSNLLIPINLSLSLGFIYYFLVCFFFFFFFGTMLKAIFGIQIILSEFVKE